jgi:hypothetical protein
MFGVRLSVKCVTGVLLATMIASGATVLEAQSTHRTRRESNANRQARIARTIEQTYDHRWEIAGGGGYLRFRSGEYLKRNNDVTFWMNGTYYLNPKVGIIVGDVRGLYGNAKVGNTIYDIDNPQISAYPFMAGIGYRVMAKEKFAIGITGEGGVALGKFDGGSKGIPSKDLGLWESNTKPVVSAGVNIDYNFYPNLAFRFTPTFVGTFYSLDPLDSAPQPHGTFQTNLGFNMGLVYRFGKIK